MRVSHEGTGLLESTWAALEGAAVLSVGPGAGDNDTSVAIVDGATDEITLSGSPGARVVNLEGEAEAGLQLAEVERATNGNAVGDSVRLGDGDVDTLAADTDDDRGHLHVPVDEALLLVNNVLEVGVAVTLAEGQVGLIDRNLSKALASLDEIVVNLRSLGGDPLGLQEKIPGSFRNDGSYITHG